MNEYIEQLKNDPTTETRTDADGNVYRMRVLGKGETLFFQENEHSLICEIEAKDGIIFTTSIKTWEGGKKMSKDERERVLSLIQKYYKEIYNSNITLSHK